MNIQGLDYNTQREQLQLPEYGREIQKMIDYAVSLPDREERLRCAKTIVKLMETMVPQIRENAGYQQTLWDHLYLMSHKQLDIWERLYETTQYEYNPIENYNRTESGSTTGNSTITHSGIDSHSDHIGTGGEDTVSGNSEDGHFVKIPVFYS